MPPPAPTLTRTDSPPQATRALLLPALHSWAADRISLLVHQGVELLSRAAEHPDHWPGQPIRHGLHNPPDQHQQCSRPQQQYHGQRRRPLPASCLLAAARDGLVAALPGLVAAAQRQLAAQYGGWTGPVPHCRTAVGSGSTWLLVAWHPSYGRRTIFSYVLEMRARLLWCTQVLQLVSRS